MKDFLNACIKLLTAFRDVADDIQDFYNYFVPSKKSIEKQIKEIINDKETNKNDTI